MRSTIRRASWRSSKRRRRTTRALVDEVFLRVLGRAPTHAELAEARGVAGRAARRARGSRRGAGGAGRGRSTPGFDALAARQSARRVDAARPPRRPTATNGAALELRRTTARSSPPATEGKGVYEIVAAAPLELVRGLRLEVLADDRLAGRRARAGRPTATSCSTRLRVFAVSPDRARRAPQAEDPHGRGRLQPGRLPRLGRHRRQARDGLGDRRRHRPEPRRRRSRFARPIDCPPGTSLVVELDQQYDDRHTLGRFRLSVTDDEPPLMRPEHPAEWRPLLAAPPGAVSDDDAARLREYYFSLDARVPRAAAGRIAWSPTRAWRPCRTSPGR